MFIRTLNQVSKQSYSTNSDAKARTPKKANHEQNVELLSNNSIVKFCNENIMQQNDINNKR